MDLVIKRFDVYLISLDPTIISPDEMNEYINTVIIAPLTSTRKPYPSRVDIVFKNKKGQIALDQLRTIDKRRLLKKLGKVSEHSEDKICEILVAMFSK